MPDIIQDFGTFTSFRGTFSLTRQRRPRTLADEYQGINSQETVQVLVLTFGLVAHEVSVATDHSKDAEVGLVVAARAMLQTIATLEPDISSAAAKVRAHYDSLPPYPRNRLGAARCEFIDPFPPPSVIA